MKKKEARSAREQPHKGERRRCPAEGELVAPTGGQSGGNPYAGVAEGAQRDKKEARSAREQPHKGERRRSEQRTTPGAPEGVCFRVEPEKRLTPRFDPCCIAEFTVARPGKMGMRVLDNCCEDHIM